MAVIQLNPVGMLSTDDGYVSSISVRYNGQTNVLTPNGQGQITLTGTGAAQASTRLVGGLNSFTGPGGTGLKLITG